MKRTILIAAVLLLTAGNYVSAQERDDEKSLQGLKGVHLNVTWSGSKPGGEREKWLQALRSQAEAKFREAAIPLLQYHNEAPGNPRLDLKIKLDSSPPTPILIEIQLSQQVRLSRDASKEMEVITWKNYGVGGPVVTEDMTSQLLNSLLEMFIKTHRSVNPQPPRGCSQ
ncbi:MAG: hypothetical protein LC794_02595 [Acidobacteria bacterium]|nr:hypothetical protein [Acidobacteriota bacterium]